MRLTLLVLEFVTHARVDQIPLLLGHWFLELGATAGPISASNPRWTMQWGLQRLPLVAAAQADLRPDLSANQRSFDLQRFVAGLDRLGSPASADSAPHGHLSGL